MFTRILSIRIILTMLPGVILSLIAIGCCEQPHSRTFDVQCKPEVLNQLEKAVIDGGHQPWRLDPAAVAQSSLANILITEYGLSSEEVEKLIAIQSDWTFRSGKLGQRHADWAHGELKAEVELSNSRPTTESGIWYCSRIVMYGQPTPQ